MKKQTRILAIATGLTGVILLTGCSKSSQNLQSESRDQSEKKVVVETRICSKDGANVRVGPGTKFAKDSIGTLARGQKLNIIEQKGNWLRFSLADSPPGWSGWINKNLTGPVPAPAKKTPVEKKPEEISHLQATGLLKSINPSFNEAWVDAVMWAGLDDKEKEYIAYSLAVYCSKENKNDLV